MFTWGMFQTGPCIQNPVWLNSGPVIVGTCLLPGSFPSTHKFFSHSSPLTEPEAAVWRTFHFIVNHTVHIKVHICWLYLQENTPLETPQSMREDYFLSARCMHKGFIHKFGVINLNKILTKTFFRSSLLCLIHIHSQSWSGSAECMAL